jgi:hypothetical protein
MVVAPGKLQRSEPQQGGLQRGRKPGGGLDEMTVNDPVCHEGHASAARAGRKARRHLCRMARANRV